MSLSALIRKAKGSPAPTSVEPKFDAILEQGFALVGETTRREEEPGVRERHWPSEVKANWCPREAALVRAFEMQRAFESDGRGVRKMQRGNTMHHYYQNHVLGPLGVLHGIWLDLLSPLEEPTKDERGRVRVTHEVALGPMPSPELLSSVAAVHRWQYLEVRVLCPEVNLSGRCDGIIEMDGEFWYLEIKTVDGIQFSRMKEPVADHVVQAGLYLYGELEAPLNTVYPRDRIAGTVLLYVDANYQSRVDLEKTFYVTRESRDFRDIVVPVYERLLEYQAALSEKRLSAPLPECTSMVCSRVKNCPVAVQCFQSSIEKQYASRRFA